MHRSHEAAKSARRSARCVPRTGRSRCARSPSSRSRARTRSRPRRSIWRRWRRRKSREALTVVPASPAVMPEKPVPAQAGSGSVSPRLAVLDRTRTMTPSLLLQAYSTFKPASLMTLPHLARSARMRSANCSGGLAIEKVTAGVEELFAERRIGENLLRLGAELVDDLPRRALGCGEAVPRTGLETRQPALRRWSADRDIAAGAAGCRSPIALSLPASMFWRNSPMATIIIWMWPPSRSVIAGRRAAIVYGRELRAGLAFQVNDVEMAAGADAEGSVVERAGLGLGVGDQLAEAYWPAPRDAAPAPAG